MTLWDRTERWLNGRPTTAAMLCFLVVAAIVVVVLCLT